MTFRSHNRPIESDRSFTSHSALLRYVKGIVVAPRGSTSDKQLHDCTATAMPERVSVGVRKIIDIHLNWQTRSHIVRPLSLGCDGAGAFAVQRHASSGNARAIRFDDLGGRRS